MVADRRVERWAFLSEFPMYMISDEGHIYNQRYDRPMRTSRNQYGHMKISLIDYNTGHRYDRSVARLVATEFVPVPNELCTEVAVLDGDTSNVAASNLVWRPRWFVWKYSRQLKEEQPVRYQNLPVRNVTLQIGYSCVIEAGMTEGLLFDDIWRSTYSGEETFPHGHIFVVG